MNCPHCAATGTPFNNLEFPTDIVLFAVLWRLRYKLSPRDIAEMFLEHGFAFTHEAVRDWEARFAPLIADHLRIKRQGQVGPSWYVDETYLKTPSRVVCKREWQPNKQREEANQAAKRSEQPVYMTHPLPKVTDRKTVPIHKKRAW
jgi:hypothetical protein